MRLQRDFYYVLAIYVALLVGLTLAVACHDDLPEPPGAPEPLPTPVDIQPGSVLGPGTVWEEAGVRVEVVKDDWGTGACHTRAGCRTFRITNRRDTTIYSRLSAFHDPDTVCSTQAKPVGKPGFDGPDHIGPGETAEVTYCLELPKCGGSQVDDSWGPNVPEAPRGVSVVHDGFVAPEACIVPTPTPPVPTPSPPQPTPSPSPMPSPTPPPCTWVGSVLVKADTHFDGKYLYQVRKPDGTVVWEAKLAKGATASFQYPPNGDVLELWLKKRWGWEHDEKTKAHCAEVEAQWNERIDYECKCVGG